MHLLEAENYKNGLVLRLLCTSFTIKMEGIDTNNLWGDVCENLKLSVSGAIFSTWFTQTHIVSLKKNDKRHFIEIGCPTLYSKATLETRYFGIVQDTLSSFLKTPVDLIFTVKQQNSNGKNLQPVTPLFENSKDHGEDLNRAISQSKLRMTYTFQNFAVSSSNQMAWAAAEAVSKNPGSAYNPLFIWGGVGIGKTHLMSAVGHSVLEKNRNAKVYFCTGEDFTNDIVEGIRNKTTQDFRNKYRKLNLLLIDDIQFIAGKVSVQEEFFHTFNALVYSGSQIILTSDQPPSEIKRLEERLKSRFEAGLIVDIGPPDFELRCAIVGIKAKQKGLTIPSNLIHMIAGNIDTPRKIEGFLIKLLSELTIKKSELNEMLIENLVGKGDDSSPIRIKASANDVVTAVMKYYSLGKKQLMGESRVKRLAQPRQLLMYILRTQLSLPYEEVGRLIGGRDHTTVMHAVDKITQMASNNVQIREDILGIKKLI
ncbi:MAG: Chromosomal replication initiator protein DnaA [Candidatus Woesebacteria bacterium GW2011_GWA1_39_21]|uniref:Chromosomal replication initiator protein DnaA n=1 Tax=Candidatus Woesebacteria bacterium GW2011_GWA1_39_21 TaxID=1618550 RepID=A0A0G0RC58_9BACT|nr:MAG: Chromosomal replication initiator protein DnaA [Candidatus Woesebacteria bacterium GW2011_GWA1_39_21]